MVLDLLGIFAAGLGTFLSPCVLPLIPIYLSALVGADMRALSGAGRGQLLLRAAWFSLGFVLVFSLLGLGASSFGSFLSDHKAALQALGAVLILGFGLKFLGVIEIPWLERTLRADERKLQTRFGWLNALIMGLVFAAGWSPCAGPVLGAVLTYTASASSDAFVGAAYLAVYGVGFALPLLVLSLFAEAGTKWIAKLSRHMRKVELVLGVGLVLVATSMALDALPTFQAPPACERAAEARPAMLAFSSPDCPRCRRMKPVVEDLVQRCNDKRVGVRLIDVTDPVNRPLVQRYRLVGVPTFVFADADGQEVARLVGEQSQEALMQALSALRGEPCPGFAIWTEGAHQHDPKNGAEGEGSQDAVCPTGDDALQQKGVSELSADPSPPSCGQGDTGT